jgi:crotonobetainyl-CoA:carnitine CoA-transferase CaiB-like acyl-CoA transferase
MTSAARLPLAGLKVIDFGDAWSSPFACTVLGDAGADVIRVEDIHRQLSTLRGPVAPPDKLDGYPDREPGARPWNRFYLFNNSERNKRGITLDIRHPTARELLEELVADCDIFAINYTPRAVQQLGLTFDELVKLNPRLVYAHVTGYGCEGSMANAVALGSTIDAWTGHMGVRGYPETTPYDTAHSYVADAAGAATLVVACLAALERRDNTGEPQCIELALSETLFQFLAHPALQTVISGEEPELYGSRAPDWAPQGVYRCIGEDTWITIAARTDVEWQALCAVLGLDADEWPDNSRRSADHDAIDEHINRATQAWPADALMGELQAVGVPAMVVYEDSEVYSNAGLTGGDFLETVYHPDSGMRSYPGPLWRSRNRPMSIHQPHFGLGEHNEDVICGQLGRSADVFEQLVEDQAIGWKYSFWPEWPLPVPDEPPAKETEP